MDDNWVIMRGIVWAFMSVTSWGMFIVAAFYSAVGQTSPWNMIGTLALALLIFSFGTPRKAKITRNQNDE